MLDKMKQIYELQKKAKEIQKKLEELIVERVDSGVKLRLNGLFNVVSLEIDPSFFSPDRKENLESTLRRPFTDTVQEVQKRSASSSSDLLKGFSF